MKMTKNLAIIGVLLLSLLSARPQPAPGENQPTASAEVNLPPSASEVVRLSEAGSTEDVIVAYVQRSTSPFNLSADQILYLRDIGISSPVITAMLNRDHELQSQGPAYNYDQKLYPPTNPDAVAPQPISAPAPEPAVSMPPAEAPLTPPATAAPVYVSSPPPEVTYFYDDLSPYGTWVELEGVGWCWQPRVVVINHTWRPYCDGGYWVYSDAGWYWQSSYSWGWAPFHYGRWHLHPRCGWVWLPDRVWGPAWVVWRSESDHCGWAPLPPHTEFVAGVGWRFNGVHVSVGFDFGLHSEHFTFVALRDFHHHDLHHYRMAPTQVTRIYNHTTVINNYTVVNKTVVNEGIKVDRVAAATHTQIRKVPIHDAPAGVTRTAAASAGTKPNSVIYRPQLKAPPARPATMVAQKVDDRHPVIQPAAIPTMKSERPAARSPSPSSGTGRSTQPQESRNVPQPAQEKSRERQGSSHNNNSSEPGSPSAAPANRNSTQNAPRPAPADSGKPNSKAAQPTPQPAVPPGTRRGAYDYNSHYYYPKGYHQASEVHSLPPINSRPTAPPDSQADRGNSQHHKNSQSGKQNR